MEIISGVDLMHESEEDLIGIGIVFIFGWNV
jgi:hypothetical protein